MIYLDEDEADILDVQSNKRKRSSWSREEEMYIAKWVEEYIGSPCYQMNGRLNWKKLEEAVKNDPHVREIFQEDHLQSTKLMECAK